MGRKLGYDLIVVGAGPAGSTAAGSASDEGIDVLLIEKRSYIGLPVQCAEHIPRPLIREINFDKRCIAQEIAMMRTYMPQGDIVERKIPGYIVDRSLFDKGLALDAVSKGAHLMVRTTVLSRYEKGVIAKMEDGQVGIEAMVVIGADGPTSTVGRWINQRNRNFVSAIQCEVSLEEPMEATEIYFDLQYAGGYAWVFPKGRTANVGVGINVRPGQGLKDKLEHFLNRLYDDGKIRRGGIVGYTKGLIPVGGFLYNTRSENILLVGDAAGQTDAITGAGIPQAIICGKIAGRVAAKAIKQNDLKVLDEYEREWKDLLGISLNRAARKRRLLDVHWNEEDLDKILRKTWIAFGDYWGEG